MRERELFLGYKTGEVGWSKIEWDDQILSSLPLTLHLSGFVC